MILSFLQQATEWQDIMMLTATNNRFPDETDSDGNDEAEQERIEAEDDLNEIRVNDDINEPDPEDDTYPPTEEQE